MLLDIADGGAAFGVGTVTEARIQYGNPISNKHAINEEPANATGFARSHAIMLPERGQ